MPYRINPTNSKEVQILKGKKWKRLKLHETSEKARRHLVALKINVSH